MGSSDRDYNRYGGEGGDYFANPASILSLSVPFGNWFGVRVRLHFWLLLSIAFTVAMMFDGATLPEVLAGIAAMILALICHEFGHRIFAHWVGGRHDEFILWPVGGLNFPSVPPGAGPLFVGYVGGMAANLLLAIPCIVIVSHFGIYFDLFFNPLQGLASRFPLVPLGAGHINWLSLVYLFGLCNWMIAIANLLPFYWFDGGFILQSLLWPFLGTYGAINITCIVGMIVAVPMFFLALRSAAIIDLIFWVLLFSSAYSRRKQLQAEGTGELEGSIAWSAQNPGDQPVKPKRRWMQPDYAKKAAAAAAKARKEQDEIDSILAKVSSSGMNSLSRGERKALERATQKQRNR